MPPLHVVKKNIMEGSHNEVVKDHIENIYWNYHAFIARVYNSSQMIWDFTNPNEKNLRNLIAWAQHKTIYEEAQRAGR